MTGLKISNATDTVTRSKMRLAFQYHVRRASRRIRMSGMVCSRSISLVSGTNSKSLGTMKISQSSSSQSRNGPTIDESGDELNATNTAPTR